VPALPLSQPRQRLAECAGQPGRVGEISQQPGTGVSPQDKVQIVARIRISQSCIDLIKCANERPLVRRGRAIEGAEYGLS